MRERQSASGGGAVRRVLADYRPPEYTIQQAHLTFRLDVEETLVEAVLSVAATADRAQPTDLVLDGESQGSASQSRGCLRPCRRRRRLLGAPPGRRRTTSRASPRQRSSPSPLLAGREDVKLLSLAVDGRALAVGEYALTPDTLTLPAAALPAAAARAGEAFEVATRVALCPRANTLLQVWWGRGWLRQHGAVWADGTLHAAHGCRRCRRRSSCLPRAVPPCLPSRAGPVPDRRPLLHRQRGGGVQVGAQPCCDGWASDVPPPPAPARGADRSHTAAPQQRPSAGQLYRVPSAPLPALPAGASPSIWTAQMCWPGGRRGRAARRPRLDQPPAPPRPAPTPPPAA